jgi:hypothetical protein
MTEHEIIQQFSDKVFKLLMDKSNSGIIDLTPDEIAKQSGLTVSFYNGQWQPFFDPKFHSQIPSEIRDEIQVLWNGRNSKFMISRIDNQTGQLRFYSTGKEKWLPALSTAHEKFSSDRTCAEKEFSFIEKETEFTYDIIEVTQND